MAVPKDKDNIFLVYNKEMFDAAGVAYPDENWTWDDLTAASAQIYDKLEAGLAVRSAAAGKGQQQRYGQDGGKYTGYFPHNSTPLLCFRVQIGVPDV